MPVLWILVNHGTIPQDASLDALYVQCSIGTEKAVTEPTSENPPIWATEMCFESALQSDTILVELKKKAFLWDAVVALASLPLKFVPFAAQHSNGEWYDLVEKGASASSQQFQIFVNLRFDFPPELTDSERACLESKMPILGEEMDILEMQETKIKKGQLSVPTPIGSPVISVSGLSTPSNLTPQSTLSNLTPQSNGTVEVDSSEDRQTTPTSEMSSPLPTAPSPTTDDFAPSEQMEEEEERDTVGSLKCRTVQPQPVARRRFSTTGSSEPVVKVKDTGATSDCDTFSSVNHSTSVVGQIDIKINNNIREYVVVPARRETVRRPSLRLTKRRVQPPSHHAIDDDLVHTAYRKALQALIYPTLTDEDQHTFEVWSAHKPTFCAECNSVLWGIARQGYRCKRCGLKCHERCATMVNADCSIHAARKREMKRVGSELLDEKFRRSLVMERMEKQISSDHVMQLQLLSECFGVPREDHDKLLKKAKEEVLDYAVNFKAVIRVRIISAERLNIREEDNNSLYVSVSIGGQRRYSKPFREKKAPLWNEEFTFECDNSMDRIKVRVWNEVSDRMSKISQKFTKESDQFLGEKIIEVRNLGESTDLWHKLDKRTNQSVVSGSIRLGIAIKVERDKVRTPYHELYSYLHLKLFNHAHLTENRPLVKADVSRGEIPFEMLLPPAYQEIAAEFAQRYSIDTLTMAIAHFKCLSQRYVLPQALEIMGILLREIKEDVLDKDDQAQLLQSHHPGEDIRYRGKKHGRLASILQQLLNSLRIDLQSYREMFPADDLDKLEELSFAIKLVHLIVECQQEALGERSDTPSKIVEDSMRQCSKATFHSLMQEWLAATAEKYPVGNEKTASPLEFFLGLMQLLVAAILEDRNSYEPCVGRICRFSLEELTAQELWSILGERLFEMLIKQKEDETFPVAEYINLLLALNQMYKDYILPKGHPVPSDIEFPAWFDYYIIKYLDSFEEETLGVAAKAFTSDKNGKFAALEGKPLSSSVFDIFWWLHEGNKIFDKLSCGNMAVHHRYYQRFAEVIRSVIMQYTGQIQDCVGEFIAELPLVTMLLNDIQQSRVNLQNIYEAMGGRMRAGDGCGQILTDLQSTLSTELTNQCTIVTQSLRPALLQGVKTVKTEIMRIKGVAKTAISSKEVTPIVSHLMNTLAFKGSEMKHVCEDSVLKKLVKELWLVTMSAFHEVLIPGPQDIRVPAASEHNFSQRQCLYLEHVLTIVKDFFLSLKEVHFKTKMLEQGLTPIRKILNMYQKSTNVLIAEFTHQETEQDTGVGESCGEINLQIETNVHPGSQELEVSVQVMMLSGLHPLSPGGTVQKPFVEFFLLGPNTLGMTRRFKTSPAKTGESFVFANEVKKMTIPQTVNFEDCELQVLVKTQGFFAGGGHVVGMTLLQLKNHIGENAVLHLNLVGKLKISSEGQTIMSVLAQRTGDELAKDFVAVKREERVEKKAPIARADSIHDQ